jgi:peptidylprolyl isomerase domain and WD repeat-containing protein 1
MPETELKRKDGEEIPQDVESDDDDIGPTLPTHASKKQRVLQHEAVYLSNLPDKDMYEKSLMHRDVVNFVCMTASEFIITTSTDGHVKFWKKQETGIEFVKHFRAHMVYYLP